MENKGQLIAMDLYESKLKQLKIRAKRDGAFNMNTVLSIPQSDQKLHQSGSCFDRCAMQWSWSS
jgi:16S rRNA (cytosine967-C5)-methyltransferase